jgi:hypothetical protein
MEGEGLVVESLLSCPSVKCGVWMGHAARVGEFGEERETAGSSRARNGKLKEKGNGNGVADQW